MRAERARPGRDVSGAANPLYPDNRLAEGLAAWRATKGRDSTMANSGSGRRSGNANNRPGGGNRPAGTGNRQGTASRSASAGGDGATRRQSADERARERIAQQRGAPRRPGAGARGGSGVGGGKAGGRGAGGKGRPPERSTAKTAGVFGSVFVVLAVVVIVLVATLGGKSTPKSGGSIPTTPAPANIVSAVSNVPASELDAAGIGGGQAIFLGAEGSGNPVVAIKPAKQLTLDGKPEIVYVGAEYCPFCAATRWALAIALSKFGILHNLKITASSPYDFAPNTHTLSFDGVTYTSSYLSFDEVEQVTNVCKATSPNPSPPPALECTGGYTNLQTAPASVLALVAKYDATPYFASENANGIPFVDMGGHYVEDGAPYASTATAYPPISLAGLSWDQIVATFTVPTTGPGQAILGAANHYIAAFCQLTHGKPGNVCSMSGVKAVTAGGLK